MASKDARIDAYIGKREAFAQPILSHLRVLIHEACPDCEETIKWGMPSFTYKGEILCNLAGFKKHVALGFWKQSLLRDPNGILKDEAMGSLGRITSLNDLPSDETITDFVHQAMKLNDEGVKVAKEKPNSKPEQPVPDSLSAALAANRVAKKNFEGFPPGRRREYIDWINEAKTEATRQKRTEQATEWIAEGKGRNWKYEKSK